MDPVGLLSVSLHCCSSYETLSDVHYDGRSILILCTTEHFSTPMALIRSPSADVLIAPGSQSSWDLCCVRSMDLRRPRSTGLFLQASQSLALVVTVSRDT